MPANQNTPQDGLGYSRHYAKRIRDTGKWHSKNQVFPTKMVTQTMLKKEAGTRAPGARKDNKSQGLPKALATDLANSPYLTSLQKPNYTFVETRASAPAAARGGGDAKDVPVSVDVPSWRTRDSRAVYIIRLETWAKATANKALTNGSRVFSCDYFYPVDAYIRFSMRKRGWVEKFRRRAISSQPKRNTSSKLECRDDEDFEAICHQDIPAPWNEVFGVYGIMSRIVVHHPVKFIWGGLWVNNLTLERDVIVNHFTKSRSFSSKVGLTQSLRELPWANSQDPDTFYPRSYLLSEDEKDAIEEDFRLTACLCLLKWLRAQQQPVTTRQDTKLDAPPGGSAAKKKKKNNNNVTDERVEKNGSDVSEAKGEDEARTPEYTREVGDIRRRLATVDVRSVRDADDGEDADEDDLQDTTKVEYNPSGEPKILPNIGASRSKKRGGEVSIEAVVWALQHVKEFLRGKSHEDIDLTGKPGLTGTQWNQLMPWIYKVVRDGARIVGVTEGVLRETEEALDEAKKYLPQFEIDGLRNIWIVKPGNMSKGIGITLLDKLESIMKYVSNTTTQGTYVMQKYIEHPLLIHRVKFDIRQWFLVTDWNPLTVWFYKDSYLRICSREYDYDTKHKAVHLSNVAIQQNYLNGKRSSELPDNNFMTSKDFKKYLCKIGEVTTWDDLTYPAMKDAVVNTLLTTLDVPETRKNAFELYGADFILSQDLKPWLLEVNSSPGMAPTSKEKVRLCAGLIDDVVKVILDRREDKNCDTGRFELVLRKSTVPQVMGVETKFSVNGRKIRKADR